MIDKHLKDKKTAIWRAEEAEYERDRLREYDSEIIRLLNAGEYSDALKLFRKSHGMVNRFVCKKCGNTSHKCINCKCEVCDSQVSVVVVFEKTEKAV